MITMSKVGEAVGGQNRRSVFISGVKKYDIIFAACSYHSGGHPSLIAILDGSSNNVRLIGESSLRSGGGAPGDIVLKVWEARYDGQLNVQIHSDNMSNLDLYSVVFRPNRPTQNVNAYLRTKASDARVWTDPITVYEGEWILAGQYASGGHSVVSSPAPPDKGGTASVTVEGYALPEGSTRGGNSFFELLRVTSDGTFQYRGPNPSVMRLTIQGDPLYSSVFGSVLLV